MKNALTVFTSEIRLHDGLYSINDLHAAAGGDDKHKPSNFMRLDTTKALIEEMRCSDLSITPTKIIKGNRADGSVQGTYVCRELVYAYAMWISPKFNLAVIRAFDAVQQQKTEAAAAKTSPPPIDQPSLGGRRWLIYMDHDGKEQVKLVPHDAAVMTRDQIVNAIIADGFEMDEDQTLKLVEALNKRLQNQFRYLLGSYRRQKSLR